MHRKSRLSKNPAKGAVETIMVRGRPMRFVATGKRGFGAWRILGKD